MQNEFKLNPTQIVDIKTEKESLAIAVVLHMRVRKLEKALAIAEEALSVLQHGLYKWPSKTAKEALEAVAKAKGEV